VLYPQTPLVLTIAAFLVATIVVLFLSSATRAGPNM
jgi:hypothetical protein